MLPSNPVYQLRPIQEENLIEACSSTQTSINTSPESGANSDATECTSPSDNTHCVKSPKTVRFANRLCSVGLYSATVPVRKSIFPKHCLIESYNNYQQHSLIESYNNYQQFLKNHKATLLFFPVRPLMPLMVSKSSDKVTENALLQIKVIFWIMAMAQSLVAANCKPQTDRSVLRTLPH